METAALSSSALKISSFKDLHAWQKGHELVLMIYKLTANFPDTEKFGLVSQLRRAAASITSNIAEGFSRYSYKEKIQFYGIALGSCTEVQNQILIAKDIGYCSVSMFEEIDQQTILVNKLLNGLIKSSRIKTHDS